MLMIKSGTFRVQLLTKWQANSNVCISKMPWHGPLKRYFCRHVYLCMFEKVMHINEFFPCRLSLTDIKSTRSRSTSRLLHCNYFRRILTVTCAQPVTVILFFLNHDVIIDCVFYKLVDSSQNIARLNAVL